MGFYDYFDEKMYRLQGTPEMREIQEKKLIKNLNDNLKTMKYSECPVWPKGLTPFPTSKPSKTSKAPSPSAKSHAPRWKP